MPQSEDSGLTLAPEREESTVGEPRIGGELSATGAEVAKLPIVEQLKYHFPNSEERYAFINGAIEIAQDSLAQGWALRRLRDRYTPDEVARLSRGSRQTLEFLIRDHVSALRWRVDEARQLISPLLSHKALDLLSPAYEHPVDPVLTSGPTEDWRESVAEMFPEAQKLHTSITAVFAEPGLTDAARQAHFLELQLALAKLPQTLKSLDKRISGSFLNTIGTRVSN